MLPQKPVAASLDTQCLQRRHSSQGSTHLILRRKLPTSDSFQWGSWHGSHLNQRPKHIILFSRSPCLLRVLQPSRCYCRISVILHPINTRLSLIGDPFKSCIRKCVGRRLPDSQKGHTTYLSEISCAMASFSFTNCNSFLK